MMASLTKRLMGLLAFGIAVSTASGAWILEVVNPGDGVQTDVGEYSAIILDDYDMPQICYLARKHPNYAFKDNTGWHSEVIESDDLTGYYPSLTLDENGFPHISYADISHNDLRYTWKDQSGWHFEIVDKVYSSSVLALVPNGNVYIAYGSPDEDLMFARRINGIWTIESVDTLGLVAGYFDMKINSLSLPYISYYEREAGNLRFAHHTGTEWVSVDVDTEGNVGSRNALAVDKKNFSHILYADKDTPAVKYAWRDAEGVHIDYLDAGSEIQFQSAIELDASGSPHVTFVDVQSRMVRYGRMEGGSWHFETIPNSNTDGTGGLSMHLDSDGLAHISFQGAGYNLSYAREIDVQTISYDLIMPSIEIGPSEEFLLSRLTQNTYPESDIVDEYILLEVVGIFYYWPGWTDNPDWQTWTLNSGGVYRENILKFTWPEGVGSYSGLRFWGGMVEAGTANLIDYDMIEWSYTE